MGDLNAQLDDPCDERADDLAMALADQGLVNMAYHFLAWRQYRDVGGCTCIMQRNGQQVTGRGYYFLSTNRKSFFNAGLRETLHGTYHSLILAVLRGDEALRVHVTR